ncbi:ABC-type oligopeptide transport system [Fructobacillus cardui]|nr:ABC-type oligopeptide transport system [Fructobacillus cardui]
MNVTIETDADAVVSKSTVDYLKQAWESTFGSDISVTEKIVPIKQRMQDAQNGNFDITLTNWTGDYQDGVSYYNMFKTPTTGTNSGNSRMMPLQPLLIKRKIKMPISGQPETLISRRLKPL